MTRLWIAIFFTLGISLAGWPGEPMVQNPDGEESMLNELIKQISNTKNVVRPDSIAAVPASQASLCEVCGQPLYRHLEPDFQCLPLGPQGERLQIQSVKTIDKVPCPVCQANFEGVLPGNVNSRAGMDRDFCAHSVGKHAVHSTVWCCPECGYSALIPQIFSKPDDAAAAPDASKFLAGLDGKPLDAETKAFVRTAISTEMRTEMIKQAGLNPERPREDLLQFSKYVTQSQIPDWLKYDYALRIYERGKAPHALMARLYLEAAHSCRREVCSEVSAPYLDAELQESLGKAISRMNRYVQSTCQGIRQSRKEPVMDPTKAETDAHILSVACQGIIHHAKERTSPNPPITGAPSGARENKEKYLFSTADMFVIHLTWAAALDRLGKIDESAKALAQALSFIPEQVPVPVENKNLEERILGQLKLLRGIVTQRQALLRREQEFLYKAARRNMAAIKFNEIVFCDLRKGLDADTTRRQCDPAPTAYLLAESFRRADEAELAAVWFAAAAQIVDKSLELLQAAESAQAKNPPAPDGIEKNNAAPSAVREHLQRLFVLSEWIKEQRALIPTPVAAPDASDRAITDQLAGVLGITPASIDAELNASHPKNSAPLSNPNLKKNSIPFAGEPLPSEKKPIAAAPSLIKTREALFKMYYQALLDFRARNENRNPASLDELVKAGLVPASDSHLNENGKLLCPETQERLGYMRTWDPQDQTKPILYSVKEGSLSLYPGGDIREWKSSK